MKRYYFFTVVILLLFACQQPENVYLYEVNEVDVTQAGVDKNNQKSDLEFISIAFTDLFDQTIPNNALTSLVLISRSLGDKALITDLFIRNMLNSPDAIVPTEQQMRGDIPGFVKQTYNKFYLRNPSEYETWYFQDLISNDAGITPEIIYYAFLTSDEYRYY